MWGQGFKITYKYSGRVTLQREGKARLNFRETRDLHVSAARLRMPLFIFVLSLMICNIFWNLCYYEKMEECGVPVWTRRYNRTGDILEYLPHEIVLLLQTTCCPSSLVVKRLGSISLSHFSSKEASFLPLTINCRLLYHCECKHAFMFL